MPRPPSAADPGELKSAVGSGGWLDSPGDLAPLPHRLSPPLPRRHAAGAAAAQCRGSGAGFCAICNRDEVAVVPHGGNTSYCGGATPDETGSQIVVSMRRLNRVRHIDAANYSMIVEAGCTLAESSKRRARSRAACSP